MTTLRRVSFHPTVIALPELVPLGQGAYIVRDRSQRPDSALTLGSAETGQVWNLGNNGDAATLPVWGVSGGRGYMVSAGTPADPHVWLESGVSDCVIDCRLTVDNGTNLGGPLFRRADGNNYYCVRVNPSSSLFMVMRNVGGVRGAVVSVAYTYSLPQTLALRVVLRGSLMVFYVDGVEVARFTSTDMQGATKHGLHDQSAVNYWDNFRVLARR